MKSTRRRWFFRIALTEGLACFFYYLFAPGGSGSGQLFAFSGFRLGLIGLTLLGCLLCLLPLIDQRVAARIQSWLESSGVRFALLLGTQTVITVCFFLLRTCRLLYQTTADYAWFAARQRLLPLGFWLILLSVQLLVLLLAQAMPRIREGFRVERVKWIRFVWLMAGGVVFGVIITVTRIGLIKDNNFFGKPTVPLLEWHLAAAFIFCLIWTLLEVRGKLPARANRFLPLLIWLLAVGIWLGIPNQNGFFSPPGRAPNFEVYPFSDGSFYGHYARSLAAGMGFKGAEIPPRPLYILVLAIFHLMARNDYGMIVVLQTLLLGLLPVLVYQIGKELHSAGAGVMAAWLVIFRETHAILSAPFAHNVSTTKYFFADLPTALAAAFFVWVLVRWLKLRRADSGQAAFYALLSGGALGMMALIRTQSLTLLVVVLPLTLAGLRKNARRWLGQAVLFALALLCCLMPWLLRNQQITGKMVFDHPMTQTGEMAASYNLGGLDLSREPGMNDGELTEKLTRSIQENFRTYPGEILQFIGAHFFNSEISNLRLFPLRDRLDSPQDLIHPRVAFWEELGNDALDGTNLLLLALAFTLIVLGVSAAGKASGLAGWAPLLICVMFNLSTAIGRYSAGRYLIPLDWVIFLCFAMGAAEWIRILLRVSGAVAIKAPIEVSQPVLKKGPKPIRYLAALLLFLAVGLLLPLSERLIPMRFVPADRAEVAVRLGVDPADYAGEGAILKKALAAYPRYYAPGEGEPESAKQGYGVADYGRMVFLTLSPDGFDTTELILDQAPAYFPDSATVWIAGHENGPASLADVVLVEDGAAGVRYTADRE